MCFPISTLIPESPSIIRSPEQRCSQRTTVAAIKRRIRVTIVLLSLSRTTILFFRSAREDAPMTTTQRNRRDRSCRRDIFKGVDVVSGTAEDDEKAPNGQVKSGGEILFSQAR